MLMTASHALMPMRCSRSVVTALSLLAWFALNGPIML